MKTSNNLLVLIKAAKEKERRLHDAKIILAKKTSCYIAA